MATASQLASVYVRIGADTEGLKRGITTAQQRLTSFGASARSIAGRVTGAVGLMTAAVAGVAGAVTALAMPTINATAALGRFAQQVGIGTRELGGLRFAAQEMAGVADQQFDAALRRMTRRIAQAAEGSGQASAALDKLGLSARELARMTPDQQLATIADRMQSVESQSDKLAIAFKIMGREGQALVPMLAQGSKGLADMQAEADRLGLTMSELDVANATLAANAMSKIGNIIKGIRDQFAIGLAPVITAVAERLGDLGITGADVAQAMTGATRTIAKGFVTLVGAIQKVIGVARAVETAVKGVGAGVLRVFNETYQAIAKLVDGAIGLLNKLIEGANKLGLNIPVLSLVKDSDIAKGLQKLSDDAVKSWKEAGKKMQEAFAFDTDGIQAEIDELFDDIERRAKELSETFKPTIPEAIDPGSGDGDGDGDKLDEKLQADLERRQEYLQQRFEQLQNAIANETELEFKRHEDQLDALLELYNEGIIPTDAEYQDMRERLAEQHADRMTDIEKRAADERKRIQQEEARQRQSDWGTFWDSMNTLSQSGNRAAWEIGKAASIAHAVVKGYEAITSSYAAGARIGGPAVGAAFAAAAAAATASQIANLKKASFSAGGSVRATGSTATPTVPDEDPGMIADPDRRRETTAVTINLEGEIFSRDQVRELIDAINEATADGAILRLK